MNQTSERDQKMNDIVEALPKLSAWKKLRILAIVYWALAVRKIGQLFGRDSATEAE